MGQKINPISIRIGITRNWSSNWFTSDKKAYKEFLEGKNKQRKGV